jgi:CelD/BcsL family acetyltransferase involved in cellulose biosynthesis
MHTICVDPRTDPLWQKLVDQHPSDAFHSPGWMRVLSDTYGFEVNAYVLLDNSGEPKAGIPFGRVADFKGERIVTLPFSDYCDPLVGEIDHWQRLTEPLLEGHSSFTIRFGCALERFAQFGQEGDQKSQEAGCCRAQGRRYGNAASLL